MEDVSLSVHERGRYLRQMLLPEIGAAGQKRLKAARVLVVGAGGLGSPAALYLAAAGVGELTVMDFDAVEISNLHRQILFSTDDVGRPKAEAAADRLRALNPDIRINAVVGPFEGGNARRAVEGQSIVVDGTDNFAGRYLVNDACVSAGIPYAFASIFRHEGLLSLLGGPSAPCYRCLYPEPPPAGLAPSCAEGGVLGILPGVMGMLQATEVLKHLLGEGVSMRGRMLRWDALAMRFEEFEVERDPGCPVCGPGVGPTGCPTMPTIGSCDPGERSVARITPAELLAMLFGRDRSDQAPILLDVRDEEEHRAEAIDGSICIPLERLPRSLGDLPKDGDLICYCRSGIRSKRAAALLADAGFEHVRSLEGGMLMWDPTALEPVELRA